MPTKAKPMFAGIGSEAVAAKTGKGWDQWFNVLDSVDATSWRHKEIADFLAEKYGCPGWWCQMITVGYEQARGLRVKHQVSGGFSASASKTIAVNIAALFKSWADSKTRAKWLPDASTITIRKSTSNRSMRITWTDDTNVDVGFFPKGDSKSQVAVEQRKLKSLREVARCKSYWSKALASLQKMLEGNGVRKPAVKKAKNAAGKRKPSSRD